MNSNRPTYKISSIIGPDLKLGAVYQQDLVKKHTAVSPFMFLNNEHLDRRTPIHKSPSFMLSSLVNQAMQKSIQRPAVGPPVAPPVAPPVIIYKPIYKQNIPKTQVNIKDSTIKMV